MKKLFIIFLAAIITFVFTACSSDSGESSNPTSSKNNPTGSSQPTSSEGSSQDNSSSTESGGEQTPTQLSTTVKSDGGMSYNIIWKKTDDKKGVFELGEVASFSEVDLEGSGLEAPLSTTETVSFNVDYSKAENGEYTAEGKADGIKISIDGKDADKYKQMVKEMAGAQDDGDLLIKLLAGQSLSGDELEKWTYKIDLKIKAVFTEADGKLTMNRFVKFYTQWGSRIGIKEIYKIENDVVRVLEYYESGELVELYEFRANGVIEKKSYYSEGEVTSVTRYDQNGEEIEE